MESEALFPMEQLDEEQRGRMQVMSAVIQARGLSFQVSSAASAWMLHSILLSCATSLCQRENFSAGWNKL